MAADFLFEVIDEKRLDDVNELLSQAETIIGKTIITTITEYTKELDGLIRGMHNRILDEKYEISDKELEKLIIRLPILIYNLNDILMNFGIKEDLSKIIKQNNFNSSFVCQEGTIADKKAASEIMIKEEILLESTWKRSVKIISQKIDICNELLSSCKKLLSKRMMQQEILNRLH